MCGFIGDYTTLEYGGTSNSYPGMYVHLYYNYSSTEESALDNEFREAVDTACNALYQNGAVDYYAIKKYTAEEPCVAGTDRSTLLDNFQTYLNDNDITHYGNHVLISEDIDLGLAEGSDCTDCNGFSDRKEAVMHTDTSEYGQNICIMEVLHPFINDDLSDVSAMLVDNDNEHQLGTDFSDGSRTPMCTSASSDCSQGDCQVTTATPGTPTPCRTARTKRSSTPGRT